MCNKPEATGCQQKFLLDYMTGVFYNIIKSQRKSKSILAYDIIDVYIFISVDKGLKTVG